MRYGLGLCIQFCVLPTECVYMLFVDLNKQRLFHYTALTGWFFITETECLLRGTDWVFVYGSAFSPHSVLMCFVWISEQTTIISLYSIN